MNEDKVPSEGCTVEHTLQNFTTTQYHNLHNAFKLQQTLFRKQPWTHVHEETTRKASLAMTAAAGERSVRWQSERIRKKKASQKEET
jgi:hypothetical protein